MDPLTRLRCDGPRPDQGVTIGVGNKPESVPNRLPLEGPGTGKGSGKIDLRGSDSSPLGRGLFLGEPDGGDLGVSEDDARDAGVVGGARAAEYRVDDDACLVLGDVGELHRPGHVADRPHPRTGVAMLVDLDRAVPTYTDLQCVQAELAGPGLAAGCQGDHLAAERGAVVQLERAASAVVERTHRCAPEPQVDALAAQVALHEGTDPGLLAAQNPRRASDDGHLGTEAAQVLAHLDGDGAGADDDDAGRDVGNVGGLAVGPNTDLVESVDARTGRRGPGGDDDVVGGYLTAIDVDEARTRESCGAANDGGAQFLVVSGLLGVVEVAHHVVAPGPRAVPVEGAGRNAGRGCGGQGQLDGAEQSLRRDAGPVAAFAPDEFWFDEGHRLAGLQEPGGGCLAAWAHAEDGNVVPVCHVLLRSVTSGGVAPAVIRHVRRVAGSLHEARRRCHGCDRSPGPPAGRGTGVCQPKHPWLMRPWALPHACRHYAS